MTEDLWKSIKGPPDSGTAAQDAVRDLKKTLRDTMLRRLGLHADQASPEKGSHEGAPNPNDEG